MTDENTLDLYGFGVSDRSGKVRWLAHELGIPVREHALEFGAQRDAAFLELNPYASVPAMIWRDQTLTESTASCVYLAEQFPERGLAVFAKEDCRYAYLRWLSLFAESFELRLVEYALAGVGIMPAELRAIHGEALKFRCDVLVDELPRSGFLVGDRFTVADIVASYSLRLGVSAGLIGFEDVAGYLRPLMARPAAAEAKFFESLENL